MSNLFSLIAHHGYALIFAVVLAEAIGLPVPAALALVAGGAAVAAHTLSLPKALATAITAMLIGDTLLFILGGYMGRGHDSPPGPEIIWRGMLRVFDFALAWENRNENEKLKIQTACVQG